MSDLISRKALNEAISYALYSSIRLDVSDIRDIINNQPIAYDVDKVISRIENEMFSAELHGGEWNGQTANNLLCTGDVYEIVKGGGVDE